MLRGTTARIVVAFLAAALITLPFFAVDAPFASAHTSRDAVANARLGSSPSGTVPHDETVTCHDAGRSGETDNAPRVRDRHRTTAAPQPDAPERPPLRQRVHPAAAPAAPGGAAGPLERPATGHSPAALQVFRC
ncbi:hypothetical protein [Streptomyces sp. BK79]|uniref:hypothetical protein n=1 Tax=Streptomyces sp. BK79 TaxID=3350097 RepID=UPI0037700D05